MTDKTALSSSPLVTVVIPAFNAESFIGEAIASIQCQTLDDWQLIVVDDGSADQTTPAARAAAGDDNRIRLIRFDRNQGISAASNAGFDAARGEFIARLDADDRSLPERLATQVAAFRACDQLSAAGTHVRIIGGGDRDGQYAFCTLGDADLKARLVEGFNTISGGTLMVRRSFVRQHQIRFDEGIGSAEDLDYLISVMAAGGQIGNVDEVLTEHRDHDNNFTKTRLDLARPGLFNMRRRVVALWYPGLETHEVDLIAGLWYGIDFGRFDNLLNAVRAVDRLVVTSAQDYGQNTSIVHDIVLNCLAAVVAGHRDRLDASHIEAMRFFVSSAVSDMLGRLEQ